MKCLNNQDKHIAYVAITELRGQAQYDFLQDYFNQIRKETLEWVKEQIHKEIERRGGIGDRVNVYKILEILEEKSK